MFYTTQHNDMMEEQSKQRRDDFKKYEMEKEHEHRQRLANMTEEEKQKETERLKAERNKPHEKMHEPVSFDIDNNFFN